MTNASPLWYAVYTKPKWEKKVADLLTRKNIEAYCPLNKVVKQWHDRKKTVEEPLFTSYVFVHISAVEKTDVYNTAGVLNFVHWLGQPAVIRAHEIDNIKAFLLQYKNVRLEKVHIRPNDRVQIQKGSLMNWEGRVLEVSNKIVKVELPSIGYNMVAQVEISNIEILKMSNQTSGVLSLT
jgi:transcription antitermination factor NusG